MGAHMTRLLTLALLLLIAVVPLVVVATSGRSEDEQDAAIDRLNCAVFGEDCPTPTPEPTPTHEHPTPTPGVTLGWHAPGVHDGLNSHEHGDAPPQWVLDSPWPPFTQTRESHVGYKGAYAVSRRGAESYLIAHIISNRMAWMHGDHDYQLWVRDPDNGEVSYWDGVVCFAAGEPCTEPITLQTTDTGERPIVFAINDGPCETWYSDPGRLVFDLGWTICGRNETFDGRALGNGTFRTIDWVIPCDRLPATSSLQDECRSEFGVRRLSFLVNSRSYDAPGVVAPN